MAQYVSFQTFPDAAFRFQITVDAVSWSVIVTWNVAAQRWYLNFYDAYGNWITTVPLIESLPGWQIETLVFDSNRMVMMATLSKPLPYYRKPGQILRCFLIGSDVAAFNTWHQCLVENPTTLSFSAASNPGVVNPPGSLTSGYNLIDDYSSTSTMLFRNKIFEVYP